MANDIVTRLRKRTERSLHTGSDVPSSLMLEAADEIERLRAEVVRLGSCLDPIRLVINAKEGKNFDAEKIAELVAKALRGNA